MSLRQSKEMRDSWRRLQSECPKQHHDNGKFWEGDHCLPDTGMPRFPKDPCAPNAVRSHRAARLEGTSMQAGSGGTSVGTSEDQGKKGFPGTRDLMEMETRPPETREIAFLSVHDTCISISILFWEGRSRSLFPMKAIHESLVKSPALQNILFVRLVLAIILHIPFFHFSIKHHLFKA